MSVINTQTYSNGTPGRVWFPGLTKKKKKRKKERKKIETSVDNDKSGIGSWVPVKWRVGGTIMSMLSWQSQRAVGRAPGFNQFKYESAANTILNFLVLLELLCVATRAHQMCHFSKRTERCARRELVDYGEPERHGAALEVWMRVMFEREQAGLPTGAKPPWSWDELRSILE